ncbi:MAG TPA: DUF899 domain-containing protein [Longimicrobium sp.]|jgi:predicted dithiol-disulfide oxidoreductase (DUF899 family)
MTQTTTMLPPVVTREEWLAARKALLAKEKEATRANDALSAERRSLPAVEIDKEYFFESTDGRVRLLDLFEGRNQLIVYHFMFDPEWEEGCSGCSHFADSIGHLEHLHARDTSLVLVSRAPLSRIEPFRARMGWALPWVSSYGSDFNYDFHVTIDEAVTPVEYNYKNKEEIEAMNLDYPITGEMPGMSVFLRDGERIFHTYSTYARGLDAMLTTSAFLDRTPRGRQEGWGGMPDLDGLGLNWLRHHDRYDQKSGCCH